MSHPFVHATEDYGIRKGPVLGFVIHMAEGGGTVGFLSNPTVPRGVSVHYVIEYTGRIVQMLLESHASGSINPQDIRTTDDPDGFYGATAAKAVMGDWWKDPNSAVISVEIEGFAASGPNSAQHGSLRSLVNDVRSRFPLIGLLGHRDFAEYKACPGKLIHWDELGGHGINMGMHVTLAAPAQLGKLAIPQGTKAVRVADATPYVTTAAATRDAVTAANVGGSAGYIVDLHADELHFIYRGSLPAGAFTVPSADCSDQVAAEHEKVRAAAIAAVEAL